jgi:hypothetical protein
MRYKLKAHAKDLLRQILKDDAYEEVLKEIEYVTTEDELISVDITGCKSKSGVALYIKLTTYNDYDEIFDFDSWNKLNDETIANYAEREYASYCYLIKNSQHHVFLVNSAKDLTSKANHWIKRVSVFDVVKAFKD